MTNPLIIHTEIISVPNNQKPWIVVPIPKIIKLFDEDVRFLLEVKDDNHVIQIVGGKFKFWLEDSTDKNTITIGLYGKYCSYTEFIITYYRY